MSIRTVGELRQLIKGLPAHAYVVVGSNREQLPEEPGVELCGMKVRPSKLDARDTVLEITVGFTYLDGDDDGEFADDEEVPSGHLF